MGSLDGLIDDSIHNTKGVEIELNAVHSAIGNLFVLFIEEVEELHKLDQIEQDCLYVLSICTHGRAIVSITSVRVTPYHPIQWCFSTYPP